MAENEPQYPSEVAKSRTYGSYVRGFTPQPLVQHPDLNKSSEKAPGYYNSDNPYPTNVAGAQIEVTKNVNRNVSFGKLSRHVAEQATLHGLNRHTARIVNPAIVANQIPGEGIVHTSIDTQLLTNAQEVYKNIYTTTFLSQRVSGDLFSGGVKKEDVAQYAATLDGHPLHSLADDNILLFDPERSYRSNTPMPDSTASDNYNPNASAVSKEEPTSESKGMVFPFFFESLNFFPEHPEKFITFQATFNGIRESYKPNWQQQKFFGRSTSVYIYESTDRNIGFSFVIWAQNRGALAVVKQRVNWLAKHCYPSYVPVQQDSDSRIVYEAPLIRFTIGDLFRNTPGVITSLTYDWAMGGEGRWELSKDITMPQAVKVDMNIDIIHDRFMQNAGIAASTNKESSDFYRFIKPENRGLVPIERATEPVVFQKFTVQDAELIATARTG